MTLLLALIIMAQPAPDAGVREHLAQILSDACAAYGCDAGPTDAGTGEDERWRN